MNPFTFREILITLLINHFDIAPTWLSRIGPPIGEAVAATASLRIIRSGTDGLELAHVENAGFSSSSSVS
jgi:hypothetical protein